MGVNDVEPLAINERLPTTGEDQRRGWKNLRINQALIEEAEPWFVLEEEHRSESEEEEKIEESDDESTALKASHEQLKKSYDEMKESHDESNILKASQELLINEIRFNQQQSDDEITLKNQGEGRIACYGAIEYEHKDEDEDEDEDGDGDDRATQRVGPELDILSAYLRPISKGAKSKEDYLQQATKSYTDFTELQQPGLTFKAVRVYRDVVVAHQMWEAIMTKIKTREVKDMLGAFFLQTKVRREGGEV
ncbi:MAG: hypothetical protein Q9226_004865 [Calogaya cf. arnoldii]